MAEFLSGESLYLRPFERDDLAWVHKWMNDPEMRGLTGEVFPRSRSSAEAWFEEMQKDTSRVWFAVVLRDGDRVIGEAGLLRMFPAWRTTDLSIMLGDPEIRGKGYGTEVIRLLLDYIFGYLNFHRAAIGVVGFNEKALRFYERVGFRREGIQREGYYYDHAYHDFIMMSMLEGEYRERWR